MTGGWAGAKAMAVGLCSSQRNKRDHGLATVWRVDTMSERVIVGRLTDDGLPDEALVALGTGVGELIVTTVDRSTPAADAV